MFALFEVLSDVSIIIIFVLISANISISMKMSLGPMQCFNLVCQLLIYVSKIVGFFSPSFLHFYAYTKHFVEARRGKQIRGRQQKSGWGKCIFCRKKGAGEGGVAMGGFNQLPWRKDIKNWESDIIPSKWEVEQRHEKRLFAKWKLYSD